MNNFQQYSTFKIYHQAGLTLVELMVALFISLAMVGGILLFATSNKSTFTTQSEVSRIQENARFALNTLSRNIGSAGFTTVKPTPTAPGVLAFDPTDPPLDNNDDNTTLGLLNGANMASDQITMNMESVVGANTDCLGQAVAVGLPITNRYFINDTDGNGLFDLSCEGNGSPGNPQVLIEGVDNMQILYGEDTDPMNATTLQYDNTPNIYVDAGNVIDWGRIMSVRIALLLSSVVPLRTGLVETDTYNLLNAPTIGPFDGNAGRFLDGENRVRRVFSKTILIRTKTAG